MENYTLFHSTYNFTTNKEKKCIENQREYNTMKPIYNANAWWDFKLEATIMLVLLMFLNEHPK